MAESAGGDAIIIEDVDCCNRWMWNNAQNEWEHQFWRLRSMGAAANLIRVARESLRSANTILIARTEGARTVSHKEAFERASAYVASGADVVMLPSIELSDIALARNALGVPIMSLVTGAVSGEEHTRLVDSGLQIALHISGASTPYLSEVDRLTQLKSTLSNLPIDPGSEVEGDPYSRLRNSSIAEGCDIDRTIPTYELLRTGKRQSARKYRAFHDRTSRECRSSRCRNSGLLCAITPR